MILFCCCFWGVFERLLNWFYITSAKHKSTAFQYNNKKIH